MMVAQADDEPEPSKSVNTEPHDTSPPRVLQTHHQHVADYVRLMMEEGEDLTLGKDREAPMIMEVFSPMSHTSIFESTLNSSCFPAQFITPFSFRPCKRSILLTTLKVWWSYFMQILFNNWKWLSWVLQLPTSLIYFWQDGCK